MNANKESHSRFSRPFAAKDSYQRLSAQISGPMIVILRKVFTAAPKSLYPGEIGAGFYFLLLRMAAMMCGLRFP